VTGQAAGSGRGRQGGTEQAGRDRAGRAGAGTQTPSKQSPSGTQGRAGTRQRMHVVPLVAAIAQQHSGRPAALAARLARVTSRSCSFLVRQHAVRAAGQHRGGRPQFTQLSRTGSAVGLTGQAAGGQQLVGLEPAGQGGAGAASRGVAAGVLPSFQIAWKVLVLVPAGQEPCQNRASPISGRCRLRRSAEQWRRLQPPQSRLQFHHQPTRHQPMPRPPGRAPGAMLPTATAAPHSAGAGAGAGSSAQGPCAEYSFNHRTMVPPQQSPAVQRPHQGSRTGWRRSPGS
jgi:hypothetical protein